MPCLISITQRDYYYYCYNRCASVLHRGPGGRLFRCIIECVCLRLLLHFLASERREYRVPPFDWMNYNTTLSSSSSCLTQLWLWISLLLLHPPQHYAIMRYINRLVDYDDDGADDNDLRVITPPKDTICTAVHNAAWCLVWAARRSTQTRNHHCENIFKKNNRVGFCWWNTHRTQNREPTTMRFK